MIEFSANQKIVSTTNATCYAYTPIKTVDKCDSKIFYIKKIEYYFPKSIYGIKGIYAIICCTKCDYTFSAYLQDKYGIYFSNKFTIIDI